MKLLVLPDTTDYSVLVFIRDALAEDEGGLTGLNNTKLTCYFARMETDNDVVVTELSLSALSAITDAHSDGGVIEVDATNLPGVYRLDLPDAALASGAWSAVVQLKDAGDNDVVPVCLEIQIDSNAVPLNVSTEGTNISTGG